MSMYAAMTFTMWCSIVSAVCLLAAGCLRAFAGPSPAKSRPVVTSWMGDSLRGRIMANGKPFDPSEFTCASWDYPLGTKLRVTYGWRGVTVEVTDRGPKKGLLSTRQLDLSKAAFKSLGLDTNVGLARVFVCPL